MVGEKNHRTMFDGSINVNACVTYSPISRYFPDSIILLRNQLKLIYF